MDDNKIEHDSEANDTPKDHHQDQAEKDADFVMPRPIQGLSDDERNWGVFCHLAVFTGLLIPFGNLIGPWLIWLIKKGEYDYVDYHGKEVINFQITIVIFMTISWALVTIFIGIPLAIVVGIFAFVATVIAMYKTSHGNYFRYPLSLRLIR